MKVLVAVIVLAVIPLALSEFSEISPWLARRLVSWAAGHIDNKNKAERYREEWLAGLQDVPGKLTKLIKALSIVSYWLPVTQWQQRQAEYLWPARWASDAIRAVVSRNGRRRRLLELLMHYGISFKQEACDRDKYFMLNELQDMVAKASQEALGQRLLKRRQVVTGDIMTIEFDHRQMQLQIIAVVSRPRSSWDKRA